MLLRRKVRITLTHERTLTPRRGADAQQAAWCPRCGAFVMMLTPEEAAALAGVKTRHIFRWLESDRLHFVETANLSPLVCMQSLPGATGAGLKLEQDWNKEGEAR